MHSSHLPLPPSLRLPILHLESPLIPRRAVVYWLPHPRIETILLGERVDLGNPAVPRRAAHLVAVLLECLELRALRDMPILTFRLDRLKWVWPVWEAKKAGLFSPKFDQS